MVTSSLSSIDILVALYYGGFLRFDPENPEWEERDRFLISHAQVSPALYAILGDLGFFDKKENDRFAQRGGKFGVHLQSDVPVHRMGLAMDKGYCYKYGGREVIPRHYGIDKGTLLKKITGMVR